MIEYSFHDAPNLFQLVYKETRGQKTPLFKTFGELEKKGCITILFNSHNLACMRQVLPDCTVLFIGEIKQLGNGEMRFIHVRTVFFRGLELILSVSFVNSSISAGKHFGTSLQARYGAHVLQKLALQNFLNQKENQLFSYRFWFCSGLTIDNFVFLESIREVANLFEANLKSLIDNSQLPPEWHEKTWLNTKPDVELPWWKFFFRGDKKKAFYDKELRKAKEDHDSKVFCEEMNIYSLKKLSLEIETFERQMVCLFS